MGGGRCLLRSGRGRAGGSEQGLVRAPGGWLRATSCCLGKHPVCPAVWLLPVGSPPGCGASGERPGLAHCWPVHLTSGAADIAEACVGPGLALRGGCWLTCSASLVPITGSVGRRLVNSQQWSRVQGRRAHMGPSGRWGVGLRVPGCNGARAGCHPCGHCCSLICIILKLA